MEIGKELSPTLEAIEMALWTHEAHFPGTPPKYSNEGFRAAIKIFASAVHDRAFVLMKNENISLEDSCNMAEAIGNDIRKLVKVYCDVETHDLYK